MTVGKISDARHYTRIATYILSWIFHSSYLSRDWRVSSFEGYSKIANHVSQFVHEAEKILGVIKHFFCNLDPYIFTLLYVNLVRPHLDYATLYGMLLLKDITALQSVQWHATRLVLLLKDKSHYDCWLYH